MSIFKRIVSTSAIVGTLVLMLGIVAWLAGARINTTKSIPVGLYWRSSAPAEKGAYVLFCPPAIDIFTEARSRGYISAGLCPGGLGYMMKRILAAKDDTVSVGEDGVRVNGKLLPFSAQRNVDLAGRPLSRFHVDQYTLGGADVLLMSDVSETSFDGRYFGLIQRSQIETVVRPVFTW